MDRYAAGAGLRGTMADMLLGEELVLLTLDDDTGAWLVPTRTVRRAVRVALVVELLARRRVGVGDDGLLVPGLAGTTGGDEVLERAAQQVVGHSPAELAAPHRGELGALLARLRHTGVLRRELLPPRRHLPRDPHPEAGVRTRLQEALTVQRRPDRHTALLVALVFELGILEQLFPAHDTSAMSMRGATITSQLREDAHYFPTSLEPVAQGAGGVSALEAAGETVFVLGDLGDALGALDAMVDVVKLVTLPVRIVFRFFEHLP